VPGYAPEALLSTAVVLPGILPDEGTRPAYPRGLWWGNPLRWRRGFQVLAMTPQWAMSFVSWQRGGKLIS